MKDPTCFVILFGTLLLLSIFGFLFYTLGTCANSRFRDVAETEIRYKAIHELNRYQTEYDTYIRGLIYRTFSLRMVGPTPTVQVLSSSSSSPSTSGVFPWSTIVYFNESLTCPRPFPSPPFTPYLFSSDGLSSDSYWYNDDDRNNYWKYVSFSLSSSSSSASVGSFDVSSLPVYDQVFGGTNTNSPSSTWKNMKNSLLPEVSSCLWPDKVAYSCWSSSITHHKNLSSSSFSVSYSLPTVTEKRIMINCPQQENPSSSIIHLGYEQFSQSNDYLVLPFYPSSVQHNSNVWLSPSDSVTVFFLPFHQFFRYKLQMQEWFTHNYIDGLRGTFINRERAMYHNRMSLSFLTDFLRLDGIRYKRYHAYLRISDDTNTLCILPPYATNNNGNDQCYSLFSDLSFDMVTNASHVALTNGTYSLPFHELVKVTILWNRIFRIMYDTEIKIMDTNIRNQINLRNEALTGMITLGILSCVAITLLLILFVRIVRLQTNAAHQEKIMQDHKTKAEEYLLSYLSHALRTPLHGITSSLELLSQSEKDIEKLWRRCQDNEYCLPNTNTNLQGTPVPTNTNDSSSVQATVSPTMVRNNSNPNSTDSVSNHAMDMDAVSYTAVVSVNQQGMDTSSSVNSSASGASTINECFITDRKELFSDITTCAKQLLGIANDIVDLSKLGQGNLLIHYTRSSLTSVLREIRFSNCYRSRLPLYISPIHFNTPPCLLLPHDRLIQILSNGLANSLKHTKDGFIFIMAHWLPFSNYMYDGENIRSFSSKESASLWKGKGRGNLYVFEGKNGLYTKVYNRALAEHWLSSDKYLPPLPNERNNRPYELRYSPSASVVTMNRADVSFGSRATVPSISLPYTGAPITVAEGNGNQDRISRNEINDGTFMPNGPDAGDIRNTIVPVRSRSGDTDEIRVPLSSENGDEGNSTSIPSNCTIGVYDGAVLFSIIDTGTGFDPSMDPELLFDTVTSFSEGHGTAGLGLGLSRRLARSMNGDAWLDNATVNDFSMCAKYLETIDAIDGVHPSAKKWLSTYRNPSSIAQECNSVTGNSIPTGSNMGVQSLVGTGKKGTPKAFVRDTSSRSRKALPGTAFRFIIPVAVTDTPAHDYLRGLKSRIRAQSTENSTTVESTVATNTESTENDNPYVRVTVQSPEGALSDATERSTESLSTATVAIHPESPSTPASSASNPGQSSSSDPSVKFTVTYNPILHGVALDGNGADSEKDRSATLSSSSGSLSIVSPLVSLPLVSATINDSASPSSTTRFPSASPVAVSSVSAKTTRGTKVLFVDDEDTIRRTVKRHLSKLGYRVEVMNDGEGVLDCIIAAEEANDPFAIILTDMVMERVSGGALIQQIRSSGRSAEQLPVIAVTGNAGLQHEIESLHRLGFSDFLWKPFSYESLKSIVEKYSTVSAGSS